MEIKKLIEQGKVNEELYATFIEDSKEQVPGWKIEASLKKLPALNSQDEVYNAYMVYNEQGKKLSFFVLSNEDGTDKLNSNAKALQLQDTEDVWVANFLVYSGQRELGYGSKVFSEILKIIEEGTDKNLYLFTDHDNYENKIYKKNMFFLKEIELDKKYRNVYFKKNKNKK